MRRWTGESVADGRYAIGEVLGRGPDVQVYRAEDRVLRRPVAVRFFPTVAGHTSARWRTEAAALDRVDHHHIIRLLDGGETVDAAFLVFPFLPASLGSRLERGPMTRAEAARVTLALAGALGQVHRAGMVHGGVDVDGVLLDEVGLPCWDGLPDPVADTHGRAAERDLVELAALTVRCVAGGGVQVTVPSAVLAVIRAAAHDPSAPELHDRLTRALEPVAPQRRLVRAASFVTAARRRARPGFAAVLGLGFAASVFAGLVVDAGTWRTTIGDGLPSTPGALVLSGAPASDDIAASARDALGSLPDGSAAPPARPAPGASGFASGGSSSASGNPATAVVDDPTTSGDPGTPAVADSRSSSGGAGPVDGDSTTQDDGAHRDGDTTHDGARTGDFGDRSDGDDDGDDRIATDSRNGTTDTGGRTDTDDTGGRTDGDAGGGRTGPDDGDGSGDHDGSDRGGTDPDGSGQEGSGLGGSERSGGDPGGSDGHRDGLLSRALGDLV